MHNLEFEHGLDFEDQSWSGVMVVRAARELILRFHNAVASFQDSTLTGRTDLGAERAKILNAAKSPITRTSVKATSARPQASKSRARTSVKATSNQAQAPVPRVSRSSHQADANSSQRSLSESPRPVFRLPKHHSLMPKSPAPAKAKPQGRKNSGKQPVTRGRTNNQAPNSQRKRKGSEGLDLRAQRRQRREQKRDEDDIPEVVNLVTSDTESGPASDDDDDQQRDSPNQSTDGEAIISNRELTSTWGNYPSSVASEYDASSNLDYDSDNDEPLDAEDEELAAANQEAQVVSDDGERPDSGNEELPNPEDDAVHPSNKEDSEDIDDFDDDADVPRVSTAAESSASPSLEEKRMYWAPHLSPRPLDYTVEDVDLHDPECFTTIDTSRAIDHETNSRSNKASEHRARYKTYMQTCLAVRSRQCSTLFVDRNYPFSPRSRRILLRLNTSYKIASFVNEIYAKTPKNTAAVLGRSKFKLSDLNDMASPTVSDLEGWGVYLFVVVMQDGSWEIYVGSSVNSDGIGARLLKDYEVAFRAAIEDGYFYSDIAAYFPAAAVSPDVKAIHCRILVSMDIPTTLEARAQGRDFIHATEAVMVDHTGSLDTTRTKPTKLRDNDQLIDARTHIQHFKDASSGYINGAARGLNQISPWRQGGHSVVVDLETKMLEQNLTHCPFCGADMMERIESSPAKPFNRARNPVVGRRPWATAEVCCLVCAAFLSPGVGHQEKVLAADSFEVAVKIMKALRTRTALPSADGSMADKCGVCERELLHRDIAEGEVLDEAVKRCGWQLARKNTFEKLCPNILELANVKTICQKCYLIEKYVRDISGKRTSDFAKDVVKKFERANKKGTLAALKDAVKWYLSHSGRTEGRKGA